MSVLILVQFYVALCYCLLFRPTYLPQQPAVELSGVFIVRLITGNSMEMRKLYGQIAVRFEASCFRYSLFPPFYALESILCICHVQVIYQFLAGEETAGLTDGPAVQVSGRGRQDISFASSAVLYRHWCKKKKTPSILAVSLKISLAKNVKKKNLNV